MIRLSDKLEAAMKAGTQGIYQPQNDISSVKSSSVHFVAGDGEVEASDYCNFDGVALGSSSTA